MPLQVTCASALAGKTGRRENRIFFTQMLCCISAVPEFNQ